MMAGLPENVRTSLGASVPFPPRLGRAEEYARLVVAIADNVMLNGETLRLDSSAHHGAETPGSWRLRQLVVRPL